jgi:phosphoesterase RecJ-like protein
MKTNEMQIIFDKIKEYSRIIIFRHYRPDGDAIGSTKGLARILALSFPEKEIYIQNDDYSDYLAFLGGEGEKISDDMYADALAVVIDTGDTKRISNQKYSLCRELAVIDHHIQTRPYGDYRWVVEEKSSSCEMIAQFYDAFSDELKIDSEAATYIYAGMVTDSGRFRFRSVSGETLRLAGIMLNVGVDTDRLYAELYLEDYDYFKFKAYVYENMNITENGVAYIHVDKQMQERFELSQEQASAVVSCLDSIRGSIIWLAFIDNDDGSIRVRLRSRFVTVNELAEKYHGGGHDCASGATVYSKEELNALLADAEALIKNYKENHTDWL